jgi:hypothetical protein
MRCGSSAGRFRVCPMLGALLSAHVVFAAAQASADEPGYIAGLDFGGSGCAEGDGTVAQLTDLDGNGLPEQLTILFAKDYTAARGPGIGFAEQRRNCNLLVYAHQPDGYQVGVASALHAGYAHLPEGTSGTQRTFFAFTFYSDTVSRETNLTGAFEDRYQRQDGSAGAGLVWLPCGLDAPLNIRTDVYLQGESNLPATMSLDSLATNLTWRRCAVDGAGQPPSVPG